MAAKAIWNGAVIAATDKYETVEGNVYFPPWSVNMQYVKASETHTSCSWKGEASYYTLEVDGKQNKDAAWFYPSPLPAAAKIKDYVAFWKGVKIEKEVKNTSVRVYYNCVARVREVQIVCRLTEEPLAVIELSLGVKEGNANCALQNTSVLVNKGQGGRSSYTLTEAIPLIFCTIAVHVDKACINV